MLRLIAASSVRLEQLLICRRCLSAVAAGAAATGHPALGIHRLPQQPPLLLQLQNVTRLQGSRRSFLTLSSVRAWFTEGPEAATAVVSPPVDASDTVATASSTFFVEDTTAALQGLLESAAAAGAEPTFASLGLGSGLWPSSLALKSLELLHTGLNIPWWLCAIIMGVSARLILLVPTMLMRRVFLADLPRAMNMSVFSERIMYAEKSNNKRESLRLQQQMIELYPEMSEMEKSSAVDKSKMRLFATGLGYPLALIYAQLGSIRAFYKATSLPVDSFQQGGILWVSDLTCIDPYFLMPSAITALLMLNMHHYLKNLPTAHTKMIIAKPLAYTLLPAFVFTMLINFPAANLFYFLSTGITAQLLNIANNTEAGKEFWKARVGLPRAEEAPPLPSPEDRDALKRLKTKIEPSINNQDYQKTRFSEHSQIQKTYRIRRKMAA